MHEQKKTIRNLVGMLFLIFLTALIPVLGNTATAEKTFLGMDWGPKYWPSKPVRGGIYNTAGAQYVGLMNPFHIPVNDWVTLSYFYEKFILTDGSFKASTPYLAESWKFLNDVTMTIKLRQGVQFHDGTTFNAESFKTQMDYIKDPKNGAWNRSFLEPLDAVEVVDTYTVKLHFKKPWATFLGVVSSATGYIISGKALKADIALRESKALARRVELEKKNLEQAEKEAAGNTGEAA
jgi:peptide/nickel transport system substrate-binding protein